MNDAVMVTCAEVAVEPREAKIPPVTGGFLRLTDNRGIRIAERVTSCLRTPSRARALPRVHERCFPTPDVTGVATGTKRFYPPGINL